MAVHSVSWEGRCGSSKPAGGQRWLLKREGSSGCLLLTYFVAFLHAQLPTLCDASNQTISAPTTVWQQVSPPPKARPWYIAVQRLLLPSQAGAPDTRLVALLRGIFFYIVHWVKQVVHCKPLEQKNRV